MLLEALNYITTLESQGWNVPEFKLHAASIHVIAGDKEKAYKYLQEAVDEGFRYFLTFENDPVLQSLHGEQLFEDLRTVIQRDLSRMQHINDAQRVEHKVPSF